MRGDKPPLSFIDFFEYFRELKKIPRERIALEIIVRN
jgi:hypothetical protein